MGHASFHVGLNCVYGLELVGRLMGTVRQAHAAAEGNMDTSECTGVWEGKQARCSAEHGGNWEWPSHVDWLRAWAAASAMQRETTRKEVSRPYGALVAGPSHLPFQFFPCLATSRLGTARG
ncbi:hypothetical protein GH714_037243 [Hevea brasiliensis]|uniref:Uncharacterized protein n=1 Tax=Hevea brasiliensis TaxID=3981 RepID=A0A6A6LWU6_HEVBR|nr:hypothetical protein GH714_037243 [Hevea brasiliensis]